MTNIRPGDLVVHVGTEFQCAVCEDEAAKYVDYEEDHAPDVGVVLTVRAVVYDEFPCPGLWFSNFPDGDDRPFASCCYRKIEKADEEFIEIIRACRSVNA